jgi:hypothetical protein
MTRWKLGLLALLGVGVLSFGAFSVMDSSAASKPSAPSQANGPKSASTNGQGNGQANGHQDFVVSGQVENLRPGGSRPMVLTVQNPNSVAIRVTSLTVTASAASSACPASSLTLPQWTGSLLVPKNGTAAVTVDVALKATAPNACQGSRWPLAYGGTAVKA